MSHASASAELHAPLAQIWSDVLAIPVSDIALDANFFALGGESLALVEVMARVNDELLGEDADAALPVTDFFAYTTIAALARRIAESTGAATGPVCPQPVPAQARPASGAVAIVGMAGRFPGAASVAHFWRNLCAGIESLAPVDSIEYFDADFFGVTPREATLMSPEQRLLLECAQQALEDAGYGARERDNRVGVFVSAGPSVYPIATHASDAASFEEQGGFAGVVANTSAATRISYLLDLKGPSFTLDTACSSSLVAVHQACRALLAGDCDLALAGGVSSLQLGRERYPVDVGGMRSREGHCRPFDDGADGTVFSAGVGLVVLKRIEDAEAAGDNIAAIIRGSAINNDGNAKVGYTAPSLTGQVSVIRQALSAAGVPAQSLGFVETHGTGTRLGDPLEVAALAQVFGSPEARGNACILGAVKANIGHLEVAAGIAGLIKAALVLKHGVVPAAIHYRQANSEIDFGSTPFRINTALEPWAQVDGPRRAGVSSFGIGGTNAHVVLEQALPALTHASGSAPVLDPVAAPSPSLLLVAARSHAALGVACSELAQRLAEPDAPGLSDSAFTLQVGRQHHRYRRFVVAGEATQAGELLRAAAEDAAKATSVPVDLSRLPNVVLLFPGQGSQHADMADALYRTQPLFREVFDRCANYLLSHGGPDLRRALLLKQPQEVSGLCLDDTEVCQPALFVVEYATASLLQSWGVKPAMMIGHSLGEYVAACLASVFSVEDALRVVAARGRLMQRVAEEGHMLAVPLAREEATQLLGPSCSLAAVNGTRSCVIAGVPPQIAAIEKSLERSGVAARRLKTSRAFHSDAMDPLLEEFRAMLGTIPLQAPRLAFVSNLTGKPVTASEATSVAYWARHLRETVEFARGLEHIATVPSPLLLEVGPGRVLSNLARRSAALRDAAIFATDDSVDHALGELWRAGVPVDWHSFNRGKSARRVSLPTYPFERSRHWHAPRQPAATNLPNVRDWLCVPNWSRLPRVSQRDTATAEAGTSRLHMLFDDGTDVADALATELRQHYGRVPRVPAGSAFTSEDFARVFREIAAEKPDAVEIIYLAEFGGGASAEDRVLAVLHLCQAMQQELSSTQSAITFITRDAFEVTGEETVDPRNATFPAMAGVVGAELPSTACRTIDLHVPDRAHRDARVWALAILEAFNTRSSEDVIAIRGCTHWIRSFVPAKSVRSLSDDRPSLLRQGGVYLITGGQGGIGRAFAAGLTQRWDAKVVLVSRRPPASEALGDCVALQADVTRPEEVAAVVDLTLQRFGRIDGVIHAAGIAGGGVIPLRTDAAARGVLAAKVQGTGVLWNAVKALQPDFFLCCSSLSALVPVAGQLDYSAANAFQDAFAYQYDGAGSTRFISVNWDAWKDVGMAADARDSGSGKGHPVLSSAHGMTSEQGSQLLEIILKNPRPQWVVSTRGAQSLSEPLSQRPYTHPDAQTAANLTESRPSGRQPSAALSSREQSVADIWHKLLGRGGLGPDDNFIELGGDSLLVVQMAAQLEARLGRRIPVRDLMAHPTISGIARLLHT